MRDESKYDALKLEIQQYQQIFESLHEGYLLVDEKARIRDVNSAYCKMVGYRREELLAMKVTDVRPDKSLAGQKEFISQIIQKGSKDFKTQHRTKGGQLIDLEASAVAIEKEEKKYLAGLVRDVTEQIKGAQKLRESEQRWHQLMEQNPQPVIVFTHDEILYINNVGLLLIGAETKDEIVGKSVYSFILPDYHHHLRNRLSRIGQSPAQSAEYKLRTLNNQTKIIRAYSVRVHYKGEEAIQSVLTDITNFKKREDEIREREERWHRLVENIPIPVQVAVGGEIVFINEAGVGLYEANSPEELLEISILDFTHPDERDEVQQWRAQLEDGQSSKQIYESTLITLAGNERYTEIHSVPVTHRGEHAIQSVIFDITERWQKEQLIQTSLKEKEVLLQEIHHRVKNNMAVVSGLLELQALNTNNPELKNLMQESQLRIQSMSMIHEKLYDSESLSQIKFHEYIKDLSESIISSYQKEDKDITVRFQLDEVELNINQAIPCGLILNELIVNAFKHAFEDQQTGTVLVAVKKDGKHVKIMVEDNGRGMPDDYDIEDQDTLGMTLVSTLTYQINGTLNFKEAEQDLGTCIEIDFELEE